MELLMNTILTILLLILVEIRTAILGKIAEYIVDSVRNLVHGTRNVDNLRARTEELKKKKDELQRQVDAAIGVGNVIGDDVRNWLSQEDRITKEVDTFLDTECLANNRCFFGSLPNLVSRRRLSKRAKKMAEDLVSHIESAGRIDQVSSRPALQKSVETPGDYNPFESRKETLEKIMKALRDPEVSKVGVYGMGGIGKTMLAKEVARQATEEKLFGVVAITTVSQTPNLPKIQQDIADKLNLKFEVESTRERAHRLQSKLEEEKNNILIILDDIWTRLDLIEVGIHFEHDQKGCKIKILLTSRYEQVSNLMADPEKSFPVGFLSPGEATNLFHKIVGDNVFVEQEDLQPLASDIIRQCGDLPLAITTVAYALKDKSLSIWKDALKQLQDSTLKNIEGMSEKVYKSIKLSYDFLSSEEEQLFLLLCSLYEEDANISVEELRRYWAGWNKFHNIRTLEDARTRVDSLVETLKAHCLLLDGDYYGTVKMHDIIRDVAISIASEDKQGMHSVIFDELEDRMKSLSHSKAISLLRCNDSAQIPETLQCPLLELLIFRSNDYTSSSENIPDNFFAESKDLKTLSWNFAPIKSLPSSFPSLKNLQTLFLCISEVKDVAMIGDLKNLKVLDLSGSLIECLPQKIRELSRLRLLDLTGCQQLKVIEPNVISNLTQLEELYMSEEFQGWEDEEVSINERRNASLTELRKLQQRLKVLYLCVKDAKVLPEDLFSKNLERYRISIGEEYPFILPDGISRSLYLDLNQRSQLKAVGLELLMERSEYLELDGLVGVMDNVVYDLDKGGFPQLKHLIFGNNDKVQYITDSVDQIHSSPVFPSLESLELFNLSNLETICHGELPENSFSKLREVQVSNCDRLTNLFPLSIVKRLPNVSDEAAHKILFPNNLEHLNLSHLTILTISSCKSIKYLFSLAMAERLINLKNVQLSECEAVEYILVTEKLGEEGILSEKILFPKLESLKLHNLPALKRFCSENSWTEEVSVDDENMSLVTAQPLFNENILFPNNFEHLNLSNLTILTISSCKSIKYLFSLAMAERLTNLKNMRLFECEAVEYILVTEKLGEGGIPSENILFPKLEYLELHNLPALKRFCSGNSCNEEVSIDNEDMSLVTTQPLFNEKILFLNNLEHLNLSNLTILTISSCKSIKYLFSLAMVERLINLKNVRLFECEIMEYVLVTENPSEKILFPKLESLELHNLPALKRFCSGNSCTEEVSIDNEDMSLVTTQPLFNEKILFPNNLEHLNLSNLTLLTISSCKSIKYLFSLAMATRLINLKNVRLSECEAMEYVLVTEKLGEEGIPSEKIFFSKLESLELHNLPALKRFCSGNSCTKEVLIDNEYMSLVTTQPLFNEKILVPYNLEHLNLSNLTILTISSCKSIKYLFSLAMAERLINLKNVRLFECEAVEYVLVTEKLGEGGIPSEKIFFPKLESLELHNLPALKRFCSGNSCTEKVSIDDEDMSLVTTQPLFNEKILFPNNLEHLNLSNLTLVTISSCKSIKYLFSLAMAERLINLKNVRLFECEAVEYILVTEKLGEGGIPSEKILFPKLESLELHNLPALKRFCSGNSSTEKVSIDDEDMSLVTTQPLFNEKILFRNNLEHLNFSNLTLVTISSCKSVKYLFSLAMAERFINLKNVRLFECEAVEYVLVTEKLGEGGIPSEKIFFSKLESLELHNLPALKRFCSGNSCTEEVSIDDEDMSLVTTQPLFNEKILFPNNLEHLNLSNLTILTISSCKSIKYLFSLAMAERLINLKNVGLFECEAMEYVLVTEKLGVEGIPSEKILFPKLESLELHNLPALKRFCLGNSCIEEVSIDGEDMSPITTQPLFNEKILFPNNLEHLNLSNLTILTISSCKSIKYLFSLAMVERLINLKNARLSKCEAVEYVLVTEKLGEEGIPSEKILFPKLESFELHNLPALKRFCSGNSCTEEVSVDDEDMSLVTTQPLFNEKVIFPNLKELTTNWSEAANEILDMSQSSIIRVFCNLEVLDVSCQTHDKPISLSNFKFLHRYPNIQRLTLKGFFVDGILWQHDQQQPIDGPQENNGTYKLTTTPLEVLRLLDVHTLRHLFGDPENAQPSNAMSFHTLESLFVEKCSRLQSFAPSFMSFHNLTSMTVKKCHGLTYLFASSTATSLVHLNEMSIINCKGMREIINGDYYKEGRITESCQHNEFVFRSLEILVLRDLPNLKSFYTGSNAMRFPSLKKLFVSQCPEMRSFSHGIISTFPSLLNTIIAEIKNQWMWEDINCLRSWAEAIQQFWDSDINTTVRKLWEDSSNFGLENLFAHEMNSKENAA